MEQSEITFSEDDFQCPICADLLFHPSTTRCGHTFCSACLSTAVQRQAVCPTCRAQLIVGPKPVINVLMNEVLKKAFPETTSRRSKEADEEATALSSIPLFVLPGALFPAQQSTIHVFEPRYLQMVRLALQSSAPIGIIQPRIAGHGVEGEPAADENDAMRHHQVCGVGVLARIDKSHVVHQRVFIQIVGTDRFTVTSPASFSDAGYLVCDGEIIRDDEDESEVSSLPTTSDSISQILATVQGNESLFDAVERIISMGGQNHDCSFELAGMLNHNQWLTVEEQQELLEARSQRARLAKLAQLCQRSATWTSAPNPLQTCTIS